MTELRFLPSNLGPETCSQHMHWTVPPKDNGLLHGSVSKESAYNAGDPFDPPGFDPWVEDPLEEEMATPSSILA